MKCAICDNDFKTIDVRLQNELRGICLFCATEGEFHGMTLEEVTRVLAVAKAIYVDQNATPEQRQHTKDMQT